MICEFCNGETKKRQVKRQHWLQGYIVEGVVVEVCEECGDWKRQYVP